MKGQNVMQRDEALVHNEAHFDRDVKKEANSTIPWLDLERERVHPRLIVLTDIGGDPDDQQSMIRLMTYANQFDIQGLIATDLSPPKPELIEEIVNAYGVVRENLIQHASGYPNKDYLLSNKFSFMEVLLCLRINYHPSIVQTH